MRACRAAALLLIGLLVANLAPMGATAGAPTEAAADPGRTWYLESPGELRLPRPPGTRSATTESELKELVRLAGSRTRSRLRAIRRWNDPAATLPWTEVTLQMIRDHRPRPPFAARILALLHTAMHDAVVAAKDSRAAYPDARPKPVVLDRRVDPVLGGRRRSSYAPVQPAVAGAAETVLTALFPNRPAEFFEDLATSATESRLWAGAAYRSDVERARELGRSIGAMAVERSKNDGVWSTGFAHPRREGEAYWTPTAPSYSYPPFGGPVGKWTPWVMSSAGALRDVVPGPHPYGSSEFLAEVNEVVDVQANLTQDQRETAFFWADGPGTATPAGHWNEIAIQIAQDYGLGSAAAARLFSMLNVAEADAAIASFEMKFSYWSIRPITAIWRLCDDRTALCSEATAAADPTRAPYHGSWFPLLETPSFPSYPSGHAAFSGAAAAVIAAVVPDTSGSVELLAEQAAMSRLLGGIHFRSDDEDGLVLGRAVADLVVERMPLP